MQFLTLLVSIISVINGVESLSLQRHLGHNDDSNLVRLYSELNNEHRSKIEGE